MTKVFVELDKYDNVYLLVTEIQDSHSSIMQHGAFQGVGNLLQKSIHFRFYNLTVFGSGNDQYFTTAFLVDLCKMYLAGWEVV